MVSIVKKFSNVHLVKLKDQIIKIILNYKYKKNVLNVVHTLDLLENVNSIEIIIIIKLLNVWMVQFLVMVIVN